MPLPAKADLTTAGAATSAPTIDEDQLVTFVGAVRDHVEAFRTASMAASGAVASTTTAALAAVGNAINTAGKVVATRRVFNTTDGKFYAPSGTAAADPWNAVAPDTGSITPV